MNYPQTIIHHEKTRQKVTCHFKTTDTTCTTSATHTTPGIVVFQLSYVPRTQRNTLFKVVWVALFYRSLCYRIGISLKSWRNFSDKPSRFQREAKSLTPYHFSMIINIYKYRLRPGRAYAFTPITKNL